MPISDADRSRKRPTTPAGPDSPEIRNTCWSAARHSGGCVPQTRRVAAGPCRPTGDRDIYQELKSGRRRPRGLDHDRLRPLARASSCATRRSGAVSYPSYPTKRAPSAWRLAVPRVRDLFSHVGQLYEAVDCRLLLLSYHESREGQILEEGITEAGSHGRRSPPQARAYAAPRRGDTFPFLHCSIRCSASSAPCDLIWAFGDARGQSGFLHRLRPPGAPR
jgi:hypothetical protein